jgi:protein-disulfide isomerase
MPRLAVPVGRQDHILGPANAPLTLMEYGDYECPFCGQAHPIVKDILRNFGNDLRFVYRHFPLSQVHPHALLAAQAAEAAGLQGRFWEMHDTLFENQQALEPEDILDYVGELALDVERFASDLEDDSLIRRIKNDFRGGVRSGVNGTPSFFINDVKYEGSWQDGALAEALLALRTASR